MRFFFALKRSPKITNSEIHIAKMKIVCLNSSKTVTTSLLLSLVNYGCNYGLSELGRGQDATRAVITRSRSWCSHIFFYRLPWGTDWRLMPGIHYVPATAVPWSLFALQVSRSQFGSRILCSATSNVLKKTISNSEMRINL